MSDDTPASDDVETHPFNPSVTRRLGGSWGEHVLPVTDWEVPNLRLVLPRNLLRHLEPDVPPVLRWSLAKYRRILAARPQDAANISVLPGLLATWEFWGVNPDAPDRWEVLFQIDHRWHVVVFGPDKNGSWNAITMHPLRDRQFEVKLQGGWLISRLKK